MVWGELSHHFSYFAGITADVPLSKHVTGVAFGRLKMKKLVQFSFNCWVMFRVESAWLLETSKTYRAEILW